MYALVLALLLTLPLFGGNTSFQMLAVEVPSTTSITTSGSPPTLALTISSSGSGSVSNSSTTYTVVTNANGRNTFKITGAITAGGAMPNSTSLRIRLPSSIGISKGTQTLSTSSVDLVSGIPVLGTDTAAIVYTFSVTNGYTFPAQTLTRTVTLTLTNG